VLVVVQMLKDSVFSLWSCEIAFSFHCAYIFDILRFAENPQAVKIWDDDMQMEIDMDAYQIEV